jgi:hypothetical protein
MALRRIGLFRRHFDRMALRRDGGSPEAGAGRRRGAVRKTHRMAA